MATSSVSGYFKKGMEKKISELVVEAVCNALEDHGNTLKKTFVRYADVDFPYVTFRFSGLRRASWKRIAHVTHKFSRYICNIRTESLVNEESFSLDVDFFVGEGKSPLDATTLPNDIRQYQKDTAIKRITDYGETFPPNAVGLIQYLCNQGDDLVVDINLVVDDDDDETEKEVYLTNIEKLHHTYLKAVIDRLDVRNLKDIVVEPNGVVRLFMDVKEKTHQPLVLCGLPLKYHSKREKIIQESTGDENQSIKRKRK